MDTIQFNNTNLDFEKQIADETKIQAGGPIHGPRPISKIHIGIKQRTKKKSLTLIEGLADDLDLKKIAKYIRLEFQTSSAVVNIKDSEGNITASYIQVSGDYREEVKKFLMKYNIWESPDPPIHVHGS